MDWMTVIINPNEARRKRKRKKRHETPSHLVDHVAHTTINGKGKVGGLIPPRRTRKVTIEVTYLGRAKPFIYIDI